MKHSIHSHILTLLCAAALLQSLVMTLSSCEKVSPTGVLIGNTAVDDRVKQQILTYQHLDMYLDKELPDTTEEYSFLVGSDSHITIDPGRLTEMLEIGLEHNDLFYCHLGDLADTKPEYYANVELALFSFKVQKWMQKRTIPLIDDTHTEVENFRIDPLTGDFDTFYDFRVPFYPVAGNHDITHNGWPLFCELFRTSFYEFTVTTGDGSIDRFIFLDSANGTLGRYQVDAIENRVLIHDDKPIRNTFTFTHTNIFRPSLNEFASTYCREELYYLLNKLGQWNTKIAFWGHVHAWDDRMFDGVRHITMPSMNFVDHPNGGDNLLVRVTVRRDGEAVVEPVGLYSKQLSKKELEDLGYYTTTMK